MKRELRKREALAIHEAGHLLVGWAQSAVTVRESVWSDRGFTYTRTTSGGDWRSAAEKTRSIAGQVAAALAGGAAELAAGGFAAAAAGEISLSDVLSITGTIDFQHAQEWLALQRHDPSQDSIEWEIVDVFRLLVADLATPEARAAVHAVADSFLRRRGASETGSVSVGLAEPEIQALLAGTRLPGEYPLSRTTTPNVTDVTTD
ncbi:hypothetical protein [Sinosporangium siamense]|uniref:Peptidase M41 domain-containing protein n=1 Tax=Sinosporangium siamense TaxID=1367973 RepID=A0A919RM03_9ACTN|nr:hypothetical protein [Sinosporangium siamense]GII94601.1 hypothetical protein Ssi02_48320 [Sinosporangium siamense]